MLGLAEGVAVAVVQPSNVLSPAAIRMQRSRERRREGKRTIRCDISTAQIEALASAGFLDTALRDDPVEVARGVRRLIDRLAGSGQGAMVWPQVDRAAEQVLSAAVVDRLPQAVRDTSGQGRPGREARSGNRPGVSGRGGPKGGLADAITTPRLEPTLSPPRPTTAARQSG
jgi:hypothetical protein